MYTEISKQGTRVQLCDFKIVYPNFPNKSLTYLVFQVGECKVVTTFEFGLFSAAEV